MTVPQPIVIGTGPSGVAAAAALIAAGWRPIMLDGGRESVPTSQSTREWSRSDPGRKAWVGSFTAFEQDSNSPLSYRDGLMARASFGVGGLSRVWGGTFEFAPTSARPSGCVPTTTDVDIVRRLVPNSTTTWDGRDSDSTVPGAEASGIAMRKFASKNYLMRWKVTPSTVAIDARHNSPTACVPCSRCLSGCPRGSIWFVGDQIQAWAHMGQVDHRPAFVARTVAESGGEVAVSGFLRGTPEVIRGSRVYIAAGAISTASILIESGVVDHVTIKDSATAFGAFISARSGR